jgi:hypothetical protein
MEHQLVETEEQSGNVLEALSAKRKAIAEAKEVFIPVPGYEHKPPILQIKYRLLSGKELGMIGDSVSRQFKSRDERGIQAAVQTFIAAVDGIFFDLEDGKGAQPLTFNGEPIRGFTAELAAALGFTENINNPDSPRDVVFGLFGNNEVMIGQHNFKLNRWMGDTSRDVNEDLFGGKPLGHDEIRAAAEIALMLGHAAAKEFLETEDAEERTMLQVLAHAARKVEEEHDLDRATMIANRVGQMLGGGS